MNNQTLIYINIGILLLSLGIFQQQAKDTTKAVTQTDTTILTFTFIEQIIGYSFCILLLQLSYAYLKNF